MRVLDDLEGSLQILERRGLNVASMLARANREGELPAFRVLLSGREHWFWTKAEVDAFQQQEQQGHELVAAGEEGANGNGHVTAFTVQELHEIRKINKGLAELKKYGVKPADLVPAPRLAGREPPVRFIVESGDRKHVLGTLRELFPKVRELGQRGMEIMRFKGLGEMDGDQLWDTTLDPKKRTLRQVLLEDALKADEMFRILMGEKVEPRREFIQKHALEVKDIDYHGA